MTRRPGAGTRLVALLGSPVRHSISPAMHNAAFAEDDLDLVYVALPTPPDRLHAVIDVLRTVGAVGANVTIPHKRAALGLCDSATEEARLVGAVNTLVWTADGLVGDNTDARGLEAVLRDEVGVADGVRAVVLGTGGAARAAAVALGRLQGDVVLIGRDEDEADAVAAVSGEAGAAAWSAVPLADAAEVGRAVPRADHVVNATPLGMHGESLPEAFHALQAPQIAYDVVYRPPETSFLRAARERGVTAHNGLGMLIAQAALSYRWWTGRDAPDGALSAAAVASLAVEA